MNSLHIMFSETNAQVFVDRVKAALYPTLSGATETSTSFDLPQLMVIVGAGNNGKTFLMDQIHQQFASRVYRMPASFLTSTDTTTEYNICSYNIAWIEHDDTNKLQLDIVKHRLAQLQPHQLVVLLCNKMPFANVQDSGMNKRCLIFECVNDSSNASSLRESSLSPMFQALKV